MPTGIYKRIKGNGNGHLGLKHSLTTRKKLSIAKTKNPTKFWLGKKLSRKIRLKISKGKMGISNINKGKKSILPRSYFINLGIQSYLSQNKNKKPTSIEKIIYNYLILKGVIFEEQKVINKRFIVDVYIPQFNLIIEADGKYWHDLPKTKNKDKAENAYLKKCGFNLIRLSEKEILSGNFTKSLSFICRKGETRS